MYTRCTHGLDRWYSADRKRARGVHTGEDRTKTVRRQVKTSRKQAGSSARVVWERDGSQAEARREQGVSKAGVRPDHGRSMAEAKPEQGRAKSRQDGSKAELEEQE